MTDRQQVYTAPTMQWDSESYTPVSNKLIMDLIEDKLNQNNLVVKNQEYRTYRNNSGIIRGVIGGYDIATPDNEFGQRVMFRNSYDKSMSFAFVCGTVVWICSNGCISGDYKYRRIHRGVITDESSTTIEDIIENIEGGFNILQNSFEQNSRQLNELKHFEISPEESYKILGELFFKQEVISIQQMSVIKKELSFSQNFRHIGDTDFTAYDLYNHITESLKQSHPLNYVDDHVKTHKLFEKTFNI